MEWIDLEAYEPDLWPSNRFQFESTGGRIASPKNEGLIPDPYVVKGRSVSRKSVSLLAISKSRNLLENSTWRIHTRLYSDHQIKSLYVSKSRNQTAMSLTQTDYA